MNLAKAYIKHMNSGITWDEFFDKCNIPEKARNQFACAAILKQAKEILTRGKK